jgi:hypothetical protein
MPPRSIRPLRASDLSSSEGLVIYSAPSLRASSKNAEKGAGETAPRTHLSLSASSNYGQEAERKRLLALGDKRHRN